MGNIRPDSGHCRVPSTTSTSSSGGAGPQKLFILLTLNRPFRHLDRRYGSLQDAAPPPWVSLHNGVNSTGERTSVAWRRRGSLAPPRTCELSRLWGQDMYGGWACVGSGVLSLQRTVILKMELDVN
ncbi:hypothetical protein AAY473_002681 [Plecturocebus cupreus]